jgi:hypothetical protein
MIKAKPLALAVKLKNIIDIYEAAQARIDAEREIQKGALDAGRDNDGIEPAIVRMMLARRKRMAKDPAETMRLEELADHYQFMLDGGRPDEKLLALADDEMSRVMALTSTDRPPEIEAIKKALGCSQGKAHKLRSMAAARLAVKSSCSSVKNEHEHSSSPRVGVRAAEITETDSRAAGGDEGLKQSGEGHAVTPEPNAGAVDAPAPITSDVIPEFCGRLVEADRAGVVADA